MEHSKINMADRFKGALIGLACGDAIGTTVEFSPRDSFTEVTGMHGGGPFSLKAGQWTDDTSMALCLAESLLTKDSCDPIDQLNRYRNWYEWGYLSSTGECFDIGHTVRDAIARFAHTGEPFCGSIAENTAGNGSIMRLAPVIMFSYPNHADAMRNASISSRTTHGATEAIECCQLLGDVLFHIFDGIEKDKLLHQLKFDPSMEKVKSIKRGDFQTKTRSQIRGSGYCVDSLEAALWCFFTTESYSDAVLKAVNLGDDADTTAAVTGQIAGANYGFGAIPIEWRSQISLREDIEQMALALFHRSECKTTPARK
ncbi:ADP-ribosylglycohydrolase family protein [Undibacterium sp. LX40W]|uniref:ADP-ribosylglycohydrolase family protein n=1 Tax=Undibacterium nitidum TaxID=2762298 RepID=A0A923HYA2_9BURK|nr:MULTISPECIES: ADP-ribosylglycohydrolase family protein [Undibacterium]MBC3882461.1 ADP-ribosylglycohydrolase family protein [Undibacterium nitidum]MBC3892742.1 ADP-ribosylglycohydrolase family protein [Undibacterium sp. LX40W]